MSVSIIKFLLIFTSLSLFCGFSPETIVKTPSGEMIIEELIVGDVVSSDNDQAEIVFKNCTVKPVLRIIFDDQAVICCSEQLFFLSQEKKWKPASALKPHDVLLSDQGQSIIVDDIQPIQLPTEIVDISLSEPHTYYVTSKHILVHNYAPIVLAIAESAPAVLQVAKVGAVGLAALFAKHIQKTGRRSLGGSAAPQPRPPQEPEDESSQEWEQKHPNGKYRDALYHHQNSRTLKSKAPKNGQKALDNSMEVKNTGKRNSARIGISENEFVVLRESGDGTFHGYAVEWSALLQDFRDVLIEKGLVTSRGKIVCTKF